MTKYILIHVANHSWMIFFFFFTPLCMRRSFLGCEHFNVRTDYHASVVQMVLFSMLQTIALKEVIRELVCDGYMLIMQEVSLPYAREREEYGCMPMQTGALFDICVMILFMHAVLLSCNRGNI